MSCQRCGRHEEARYHVRSDLIDMKVCGACAVEAGRLGIAVELLGELELPVTDQSSCLHAPW
jgi:ribosome-binding protein aMBF1 (putative translation factor)